MLFPNPPRYVIPKIVTVTAETLRFYYCNFIASNFFLYTETSIHS